MADEDGMGVMVSKSEQIYQLYWSGKGLTDAQIAEKVGCHVNYVRVAARQRAGKRSTADLNYERKKREAPATTGASKSSSLTTAK